MDVANAEAPRSDSIVDRYLIDQSPKGSHNLTKLQLVIYSMTVNNQTLSRLNGYSQFRDLREYPPTPGSLMGMGSQYRTFDYAWSDEDKLKFNKEDEDKYNKELASRTQDFLKKNPRYKNFNQYLTQEQLNDSRCRKDLEAIIGNVILPIIIENPALAKLLAAHELLTIGTLNKSQQAVVQGLISAYDIKITKADHNYWDEGGTNAATVVQDRKSREWNLLMDPNAQTELADYLHEVAAIAILKKPYTLPRLAGLLDKLPLGEKNKYPVSKRMDKLGLLLLLVENFPVHLLNFAEMGIDIQELAQQLGVRSAN